MEFTGKPTRVIFRSNFDLEAKALFVKRNWWYERPWDYVGFDRSRTGKLLPVYRPAGR